MRSTILAFLTLSLALTAPAPAGAGCGCDKPPPPLAQIRPFVGHVDQTITVFDDRLQAGGRYDVLFEATVDGSSDWSRGKALVLRDLADAKPRTQLKVRVADVGLGPCRITVYSQGTPLLQISQDHFTVAARPIILHDFKENLSRSRYRAAVGSDGTIYIPVDVAQVNDATTFTGNALGFPGCSRSTPAPTRPATPSRTGATSSPRTRPPTASSTRGRPTTATPTGTRTGPITSTTTIWSWRSAVPSPTAPRRRRAPPRRSVWSSAPWGAPASDARPAQCARAGRGRARGCRVLRARLRAGGLRARRLARAGPAAARRPR